MSSFVLYVIGYILFLAGLAWVAHLLGAPPVWIGAGLVVLAGIGIMSGVKRTRLRDSEPATEQTPQSRPTPPAG